MSNAPDKMRQALQNHAEIAAPMTMAMAAAFEELPELDPLDTAANAKALEKWADEHDISLDKLRQNMQPVVEHPLPTHDYLLQLHHQ